MLDVTFCACFHNLHAAAQIKAESILDEGVMRQIWFLIEEYAIHEGEGYIKINYDGFSQVGRFEDLT